jgi:GNAT superfamily N-acetyltransferase
MSIEVRELKGKSDLKTFIYLPEKIHRDHSNWVHPMYADEWLFFNPAKNKSFSYCDSFLALAWDNGKPVGRIMGIINRRYNETHNENNARFCFLECYKDLSIARKLLEYTENWARQLGMVKLVGPLGFSDKDPQGLMIEGFQERIVIASNFNFPWLPEFLEKLGYLKEIDLVSYKFDTPSEIPEFFQKVFQRAILNHGYKLIEFHTRKSLRPWIVPIFTLLNETYSHIYGFAPMLEKEMNEFADRYMPILNPEFIKVITDEQGEAIAFVISMPEISEGIRRARGRLFPFGFIHILLESRRTKMLTMLLGAIKEPYRGKGLDSIMGIKILESAKKNGMEFIDGHLVLENNIPMRAEYERMNGVVHKRYRIFQKALN